MIRLISLCHELRKVNEEYQLGKRQQKNINHLLFMNDLKLYENNEKEAERLTDTIRILSKDIVMEFHTSKCAYIAMKAGKLNCVSGREISFQN